MDREKILALIDVAAGRGLEIGALTKPVVTRDMGRIEYVDRATTAELQRWYSNQGHVEPAQLVEVDHVWGSQTLLECVGGERCYDYVVASHVLEHVPDLFGWLCEIASVLRDGAIASFVVPDKRYTFDAVRRTSNGSDLVDAYVRRLRKPGARQIFDHFSNHREIDATAVREGLSPDTIPPTYNIRGILEACQRAAESGEYIDAHCWVFTPRSFVDAIDLGTRLFLVPFEIGALHSAAAHSNEFYVSLRRLPESMSIEDRRLAFLASREKIELPREDASLEAANERALAAERQLAALLSSTSWRITAPLRRLASAWRQLGRGA